MDLAKLLYADDLALVGNGKQELQESLEEWNGLFTRHGLKINVEKTDRAAHRPPEGRAGHRAGWQETDSGGQFRVPRRGSVRRLEDGERGTSKSTGRSECAESRWRVMTDRRISKRLKGKVMSTCVTPACLYGTETLAMTELQQQRLQVCENNWVRKIAGVKKADRRRMQCSAQVFKRAGCHLKRAHLARWTDRQKGTISAVNGRKRAQSARWTEQKGHNQRGERNKKGTIDAVNGTKRALLTWWTYNNRGTINDVCGQ